MAQDDWTNSSELWNMSLATLWRLDSLMKRLSFFLILGKSVAAERVLYEFYKESNPFLDKEEKLRAEKLWNEVIDKRQARRERGRTTFGHEYMDSIHAFDFWLRNKLYQHDISYSKRALKEYGLDLQRKRFGIAQN